MHNEIRPIHEAVGMTQRSLWPPVRSCHSCWSESTHLRSSRGSVLWRS